ncbi:hypothetical protein M3B38_01795 [Dietzia cinnamea]|uniref:hypothetical protein n=1 Tax=Dietzia cinnamea TaxID=321318 RepID=UPI0021A289EF|nr:hypothetical protein [Dietzia cinnamea]MCT1710721.1 hypothetical protein [Dietzia cinnamea]
MSKAHISLDLAVEGHVIGTVKVPITLRCGEVTGGIVPVTPDTDELTRRLSAGLAAFQAAVEK